MPDREHVPASGPLTMLVSRTTAVFSFRFSFRYLLGLGCVLLVVILWVGSGFITEHVFEHYSPKPFFVTYFNTASFALNFLVLSLKCLLEPTLAKLNRESVKSDAEEVTIAEPGEDVPAGQASRSCGPAQVSLVTEQTASGPPRATFRETLLLAFQFCLLWFAANWAANASYNYTSVPSVSILSSTSGFFTLLVGVFFGIEKFSWKKLIAVMVCLAGVTLVMTASHSDRKESGLLGDCLALLSALLYGFYATLVKKCMGGGESVSPSLFFGLVGFLNIIMLWPGFVVLHYAGVEPFDMPSSGHFWTLIVLNAVLGTFLSDYAWLWGVLLTSPLVVTLGICLTIPLSIIAESIIKGRIMSTLYFLGALLVIIGFVLVNLAGSVDNKASGTQDAADTATTAEIPTAVKTDPTIVDVLPPNCSDQRVNRSPSLAPPVTAIGR